MQYSHSEPAGSVLCVPLESIPQPALVLDADAGILDVNSLLCERVAYARSELIGRSLHLLDPELDLTAVCQRWGTLHPGQPLRVLRPVRARCGREAMMDISIGLLADPAAQTGPRRYLLTWTELNHGQGLRSALRQSQARFHEAASAAGFGTFRDDLVTGEVRWSREFREIVGLSGTLPVRGSSTVLFNVHPDDLEEVRAVLHKALDPARHGRFYSVHRIHRQSDQSVRWVQLIGRIRFHGDPCWQPAVFDGILLDITERIRTRQDLHDSQRRFQLALRASPVALFEQDLQLRYTWRCNSHFGYLSHQVLGKTDEELLPAEVATTLMDVKRRVLGDAVSRQLHLAVPCADGRVVYMDAWIHARFDESGAISGVIGTSLDVTDASLVRQRLEDLNVEMKQRSMEVESANLIRSRFLSTVSHELRTPLHTLLGYVRLAQQGPLDLVQEHLRIAERSGQQLLRQIGDLLNFNRMDRQLGALHPKPVLLEALLRHLERTGQMLAQPGANQFVLSTAADLPASVKIDENRLLQVLDNLISNACKFTRMGRVELSIQREPGPAGVTGQRWRFAVQDNGVGIGAKDLSKIFDPFVRLDSESSHHGLGLGLSIVRQWIAAMGSEIHVESRPGQGSRFWFVLEMPESAAAVGKVSYSPDCAAHCFAATKANLQLLVVDDVAENRDLLQKVCSQWGYVVHEAEGVAQALNLLSTLPDGVDAILVDQYMLGASGWDLLQQLRADVRYAALPMVMISASDAVRPVGLSPQVAFDLMLGKPLDFEALACFLCERLALVCCPADAVDIGTTARPALPASERLEFERLLAMGRVTRLADWATGLGQRQPQFSALTQQVHRLAMDADLPGLESLAQSLRG